MLGAGVASVAVEQTTFDGITTEAGELSAVTAINAANVALGGVSWANTTGDGFDCLALNAFSAIFADLATRDNMPTIDEAGAGVIGPRETAPDSVEFLTGTDPRFLALQEVCVPLLRSSSQ